MCLEARVLCPTFCERLRRLFFDITFSSQSTIAFCCTSVGQDEEASVIGCFPPRISRALHICIASSLTIRPGPFAERSTKTRIVSGSAPAVVLSVRGLGKSPGGLFCACWIALGRSRAAASFGIIYFSRSQFAMLHGSVKKLLFARPCLVVILGRFRRQLRAACRKPCAAIAILAGHCLAALCVTGICLPVDPLFLDLPAPRTIVGCTGGLLLVAIVMRWHIATASDGAPWNTLVRSGSLKAL